MLPLIELGTEGTDGNLRLSRTGSSAPEFKDALNIHSVDATTKLAETLQDAACYRRKATTYADTTKAMTLQIYTSLNRHPFHTSLDKLLRHIRERHPLHALVLVDIFNDPADSQQKASFPLMLTLY